MGSETLRWVSGRFLNLVIIIMVGSMSVMGLVGCGIQDLPRARNGVDAATAEVTNQYKRRSDLIPNLVNTVKGYSVHEKETLEAVISARARATQLTVNSKDLSPEKLKEFQQAQGQLSQALGKLMVVSENYPQLKADQNFRDLQAQLEGTENRITVARQRVIAAINDLNNLVTVPPTSWVNSLFFHYEKMNQWDLGEEEKVKVEKAPEVQFK